MSLVTIRPHDFVPAHAIIVGTDRVRQDFGDLNELAESIKSEGLLQPPVVNQDLVLVAGERRLRAMRDVLKFETIPVIYFETLDEAHLARLESEENTKRKPPTWQERVLSVDKVHTKNALAGALASKKWGQQETGKLLGASQASVSYCLLLAGLIRSKDEQIMKAGSMSDALRMLLERKENEANKALVKQTMGTSVLNEPLTKAKPSKMVATPGGVKTPEELDAELFGTVSATSPIGMFRPAVTTIVDDGESPNDGLITTPTIVTTIPLSKMFSNLDGVEDMVRRRPGFTDHIITDLPYGIEMDNIQQDQGGQNIDATRLEHDVAANLDFYRRLFPIAYESLRDGGFFIGFYDLEHHNLLHELAHSAGFKRQSWPLIWSKTHRCSNQAANFNFTKSHEVAFVFRKGNATLLQPQDRSVWTGSNEAEAKALGHPFAKPFKWWQWVYNAVCQRGQTVYDPCVGRGSSTIAALDAGLKPLASEKNSDHHAALMVNTQNWYRLKDPSVQFV